MRAKSRAPLVLLRRVMLHLTPRLTAVADLVLPCDCVADIGTDHAYVPIYLLQAGKVSRAIAADIHKQPLENARRSVEHYGLEDRVELRLSDGLQNICAGEAQTIIIAGMGGEQIAEMLYLTPWLQKKDTQLVLQPMTHSEDVRRALRENGFSKVFETTVAEGRRIYLVISAAWNDTKMSRVTAGSDYIGALRPHEVETDRLFLQNVLRRLQTKADALREKGDQQAAALQEIIREVSDACR